MVACSVTAADGLQATCRLDGFRTGGLLEVGGLCAVDDMCPLSLQLRDMGLHRLGHHAALGDHKTLVAGAGSRLEHAVAEGRSQEQTVADVVAVEAGAVDGEDGLDELRCQLAHLVDGELHEQLVSLLLPHVADGQVDEEVVVGFAPLQETLAALHVLHEVRGVAPDGVRRTHVDRCIELPAGPGIVLRRITGAVEEHVVDAGAEH